MIASVFSSITESAWIEVWFLVELISIFIIALGCAGEVHAELHKFKDRTKSSPTSGRLAEKLTGEKVKERWKLLWGGVVVVGLAIEFAAFTLSYFAANNEIEGLRAANLELEKQVLVLKQEMAQTSTNVANLDTLKWPVYSLTAEVRLRFKPQQELIGDLNFPTRLIISAKSGNPARKVVMVSSTATLIRTQFGRTTYLLPFSSAFRTSGSGATTVPLLPGASAKKASEDLDVISLQITNFPASNATVNFGMATIVLNGIIWKQFPISPGAITNGGGTLSGEADTTNFPDLLLKLE